MYKFDTFDLRFLFWRLYDYASIDTVLQYKPLITLLKFLSYCNNLSLAKICHQINHYLSHK